MIIDTHIHIWDLERSSYTWLKTAPDLLNHTYALTKLEPSRLKAGIGGGILVQADNSLADTTLMVEAARQNSWIKGIVGWLPLLDTAETKKYLQTFVSSEKYFKGVRHLIHDEPDDDWLLQPAVIESLKLLAACGLPYDVVGVKPGHIKTVLRVAKLVPGLKMVFDHLNQPPVQSGEKFGEWGEYMQEAAKLPNFFVKISGLGTTAGSNNFNVGSIKPYINFVLEKFGANRCFCGGDWPVSLLGKDYINTWDIYKQVIEELVPGKTERELIFSGNAISFYNLDDMI